VRTSDFFDFLAVAPDRPFDCMIEAKKKDLALFRPRRELRGAEFSRRTCAARRDRLAPTSGGLRADRESDVAVQCLQQREHLVGRFPVVRLIEQTVKLRRRGPQAPDELPP
jgi:hypothetical protein